MFANTLQKPLFVWGDFIDDDPDAVTYVLPALGVPVALGQTFECILPECHCSHMAVVRPSDLKYVCLHPSGFRTFRIAEVFASQRYGKTPRYFSAPLAMAWQGRLAIEAGLLTLDLPDVDLRRIQNQHMATRVLEGIVLLQAIHSADGERIPEPCEFSRAFGLAWIDGVSTKGLGNALRRLAAADVIEPHGDGYLRREQAPRQRGPKEPPYRYELTGRGLSAERDGQQRILAAITTEHLASPTPTT